MIIKHCIIVKWNNKEEIKDRYEEIKNLFNQTLSIKGIYEINLVPNVINRSNRYDLMISIEMDESSLEDFDKSQTHKDWKDNYSCFIEQKTIFDFEVKK